MHGHADLSSSRIMMDDDSPRVDEPKYARLRIMKIVPELVWKLEDKTAEPLDPRLLPLLEAIGTTASLAGAVTACGISYRAAWGLVQAYREKFGVELVRLERGRGASLTPAGLRLLGAHQSATLRLNRILPGFAVEIGPRRRVGKSGANVKLRVAASHDLALAARPHALSALAVGTPRSAAALRRPRPGADSSTQESGSGA